jgi:hypothetical protein
VHAKELTAAKDGELQSLRLLAASQAQQLAASSKHQREDVDEPDNKRARLAVKSSSPLDDDELLDTVFSFVGIGDYIYTGAVSRRWKGRYIKLCHNKAKEGKDRLTSAHKSAFFTAARLQLALKSSLKISALQSNHNLSEYVARHSVEPIAVLTLVRVRGLQWPKLRMGSLSQEPALLQWLHECGCPWDEAAVCKDAARSGRVDVLMWLQQVTASWADELKRTKLFEASWQNMWEAAKWLRQQGADWPSSFYGTVVVGRDKGQVCWTAPIVKWALDNGCTWGEWQCNQLQADLYATEYRKWQAINLFAWAHKNGCPCTCTADSD